MSGHYQTDSRDTKWGAMASIYTFEQGHRSVEVMVFNKPGRDHEHEVYEIAMCINGHGSINVGENRYELSKDQALVIPPNTPHHMIPDEDGGFEFVIWYSETEPSMSVAVSAGGDADAT